MFDKRVIGLREAQLAIEAIIKEASKDSGRPIAVAVTDDRGDLISFVRMDGARPRYGDMAIKKAYTSSYNGRDTRKSLENRQKWDWGAYEPVDSDTTVVPGGIAIVKPGETTVYGGIGTSCSRSADEEEALALVGLKALQTFLWPSQ